MKKLFKAPVNKNALCEETIVAVEYGDPTRTGACAPRSYTCYTLVMKSGRRYVVDEMCGEICFSLVEEVT